MLIKVITILFISISICLGHVLPNTGLIYHGATSPVNFHRDDVSMQYKYNPYHTATIYRKNEKEPHGYSQSRTLNPTNLRSIQYAPLLPGAVQLPNTKFNKVNMYNNQEVFEVDALSKKTEFLEPRLENLPTVQSTFSSLQNQVYPVSNFDYASGQNIQVLRSINRSPGHNAVYRNYENRDPGHVDINKINHLNQFRLQPNRIQEYTINLWSNEKNSTSRTQTSTTTTTTLPTTRPHTTTLRTTTVKTYLAPHQHPKQYLIPKYVLGKQVVPDKQPYSKMHSLLLNVARYNMAIAATQQKALHSCTNPSSLGQLLIHQNQRPLLKIPGSMDLNAPLSDQKTFLHPLQKNQIYRATLD